MRTALIMFLAMLLVGNLFVAALPIDDSDAIFDHILNRSRTDNTGCIGQCISCAKYAGLYADTCIRGCINEPIDDRDVEVWNACNQFLNG